MPDTDTNSYHPEVGNAKQRRKKQKDRRVDTESYFGADPSKLVDAEKYGIVPQEDYELCRVSYLYLLQFGNSRSPTEYGGAQVRAWTYLYLPYNETPIIGIQRAMQDGAHRAAQMYNSDVETHSYINSGTGWADGYLDGFDMGEISQDYWNWEVEPVTSTEGGQVGVVQWSVELYNEVCDKGDPIKYADLAGLASGTLNPWKIKTSQEPGKEEKPGPQIKWNITYNESRDKYDIHPPAHTDARRRASKFLPGKDVYINDKFVGSLDEKPRAWLSVEYGGDPKTHKYDGRVYWSREGLVQETPATYQAIRKGGNLYQVRETEDAVYLVTAAAKDDDYEEMDPDEVPLDMEAQEGEEPTLVKRIKVQSKEVSTPVRSVQDEQIIDKLGMSNPPYSHKMDESFHHPDFKSVQTDGRVFGPEDLRDDDQSGLGDPL